jgi:hypothetical protein
MARSSIDIEWEIAGHVTPNAALTTTLPCERCDAAIDGFSRFLHADEPLGFSGSFYAFFSKTRKRRNEQCSTGHIAISSLG